MLNQKENRFLLDERGGVIGTVTKDGSLDYTCGGKEFMGTQRGIMIEEDLLTMRPSTQEIDQDQPLKTTLQASIVPYQPVNIDLLGK